MQVPEAEGRDPDGQVRVRVEVISERMRKRFKSVMEYYF
jgi:hypothetical protein